MENPTPPPLPGARNWRTAAMLNIFLPGAGLCYVGRRVSGAVLLTLFLLCLLAALGIFLAGYVRYFQLALGGHILEGDSIEQIGTLFHPRWLIGLAVAATLIQVAAMGLLAAAKRTPDAPRGNPIS